MSGVGELQTVSAAFDLAKLAIRAGYFLGRVYNASQAAREVCDRIKQLEHVLDGVDDVLTPLAGQDGNLPENYPKIKKRLYTSIKACRTILERIERKVGGFDNGDQHRSLTTESILARVKFAFRQPGLVSQLEHEMEARTGIIQTDLLMLNAFGHTYTNITIRSNQEELRSILYSLGAEVSKGNELLTHLLRWRQESSLSSARFAGPTRQAFVPDDGEQSTIESLKDCLRTAGDFHERQTSEHIPDEVSMIGQREVLLERDDGSAPSKAPSTSASRPISRNISPSRARMSASTIVETDSDDGEAGDDNWPEETLDGFINEYREQTDQQYDAGHYTQAEINLQNVIRYSEMRERCHLVPFDNKVDLREKMVILCQKQGKWGDAIKDMRQLLSESSARSQEERSISVQLVKARQNQMLASIYYEKHQKGPPSSTHRKDVESAETYARRAFNIRFAILKSGDRAAVEHENHSECVQVLARILEARGRVVEARKLLESRNVSDGSSTTSDSVRRVSTATSRPPTDEVAEEDPHATVINALKSGDKDKINELLRDIDLDIECLSSAAKTELLMHAAQQTDDIAVKTIKKLLVPVTGVDVDVSNRRGQTALHLAAGKGCASTVRCLLEHDANVNKKDRNGETSVVKAIKGGYDKIVQALFDKGADMHITYEDGWTVLHHAICQPNAGLVKFLLELAPHLKDAADHAGHTALHHCAEREWIDQAKALLPEDPRKRVDVDAQDLSKRTPLFLVARKVATPERKELVELLLGCGADPERTPWHPKFNDYPGLRPYCPERRIASLSRTDSTTTVGTNTTSSSRFSRLSSALPRLGRR